MADMWARSRLTASPPLRPATRASSEVNSWAVPFAWAARPPLLAISFCFAASIDAKPRLLVEAIVSPLELRALRVKRFQPVHKMCHTRTFGRGGSPRSSRRCARLIRRLENGYFGALAVLAGVYRMACQSTQRHVAGRARKVAILTLSRHSPAR